MGPMRQVPKVAHFTQSCGIFLAPRSLAVQHEYLGSQARRLLCCRADLETNPKGASSGQETSKTATARASGTRSCWPSGIQTRQAGRNQVGPKQPQTFKAGSQS